MDTEKIGKLEKKFNSAQKRQAWLDVGRARRAMISEAIDNGMRGWTEQQKRIVTDDHGNLLPRNGYESEI